MFTRIISYLFFLVVALWIGWVMVVEWRYVVIALLGLLLALSVALGWKLQLNSKGEAFGLVFVLTGWLAIAGLVLI